MNYTTKNNFIVLLERQRDEIIILMNPMLLEVCVDSLESATNAVYNGADELEVCSTLSNGGLTPSFQLVQQIIDMIDLYVTSQGLTKEPKVNVMIRCREGWDFCYNDHDTALMLRDIIDFKNLDVNRFVFGGLTETRDVDVHTCKQIVEHARPIPVTFHRAFDQSIDPIRAMESIIQLGFDRVLTSGQRESAAENQALILIKSLIHNFGDKIQIMPGAGINTDNAIIFAKIGCGIIHGSFKREKFTSSNEIVYVTDGEIVRKVKHIINNYKK